VVNAPGAAFVRGSLFRLLSSLLPLGNHWFTLRCHEGRWFNVDSKLAAPEELRSEADVVRFLQHFCDRGASVFLVPRTDGQSHSDAALSVPLKVP
jgi:hypothetical protein